MAGVAFIPYGADVNTQRTTGAVLRCHLVTDVRALGIILTLNLDLLERGGRILGRGSGERLAANHPMGADERALATMGAELLIPHRDFQADISLFDFRGTGGISAIRRQQAYRYPITTPGDDFCGNVLQERISLRRTHLLYFLAGANFSGQRHFDQGSQGIINGFEIATGDVATFAAIGFLHRGFDLLYCLRPGQNP